MNSTIPLVRIAGVRVGLRWSVAGVLILVTVVLAIRQLPEAFPGRPAAEYVLSGIASASMRALSLLAHAVVARRNEVAVDGITL